jgi:hypothetical protein
LLLFSLFALDFYAAHCSVFEHQTQYFVTVFYLNLWVNKPNSSRGAAEFSRNSSLHVSVTQEFYGVGPQLVIPMGWIDALNNLGL